MFGLLKNKNKTAVPTPTRAESTAAAVRPKAPRATSGERAAKGARVGSAAKKRAAPEPVVIRRREAIPGHEAVLSADDGPFALPDKLKADYAILLGDRKSQRVDLVISEESRQTSRADPIAMTLSQRCKEKGYQVERRIATRDMLNIIYEAARRRHSDEAALRSAGQLEEKFDRLIQEALRLKASDIHIEVRRETATLRFRRNGKLAAGSHTAEWPVDVARSMATVIYQVISDEKDVVFKENEPQDSIIDRTVGGERIRLRLATMPAYPSGFDFVMRLLPMGQSQVAIELSDLGYTAEQCALIESAMAKPVGVVVLAGTTGSGKSTSLVAMLESRIRGFSGEIKVITVEDPPEYVIRGATQVPVIRGRSGEGSEKKEFARAIRAAMRCDPDILMIGEVRDEISGSLLRSAVQSGHQCFTTIHASSPFGIVGRLRHNGIGNDVLGSADFLSGLVYQTLVPVLCPHCAIPAPAFEAAAGDDQRTAALFTRLRAEIPGEALAGVRFRNPEGCDAEDCRQGIAGRSVVAEVMVPDLHVLRLIGEGRDIDAEAYHRTRGQLTLHDHGLEKLRAGLCDPRDMEAKIGPIDSDRKKAAAISLGSGDA
ncbi:type II secretory ATPase GspE/PulE/Tfp pilus assembly ATPase PilB-like protein [Natronocella acetinitrilica]|uniref:Type II secretory ATPase GspE/PulE/Tfp pilus assembly ATPase PilB-like protein n=1 Tax=Natronocella acetinitrilica TaxID=414046 RepID=A0AAE3G226_9GAMM|nr:ATPase, T2SS/T4P/T4SS family [Natronocella acetinitrilica]MCP1674265.1 type II secretory ATPase GspE/PulE/Tfp pilus assembly ATPase PilB-like protein [Natronocella acetinitrilica]